MREIKIILLPLLNFARAFCKIIRKMGKIMFGDAHHPNVIHVPRDTQTLPEAYLMAQPGDTIRLAPGTYALRNPLLITKNVAITSESGEARDVTVEAEKAEAFIFIADAELIGLAVRNSMRYPAISVTSGRPAIRDCDISSLEHEGVLISGQYADPLIENCLIHDCGHAGVRVCQGGRGTLSGCWIFRNGHAGVQASDAGTYPTVENCAIYDGRQGGIFVYDGARGVVAACEIRGNQFDGIAITDPGSKLCVTESRVFDGNRYGIFVAEAARGDFAGCEIFGNRDAGVSVQYSGNPTFVHCRIRDGSAAGVFVTAGGKGVFRECEVTGNAGEGVSISYSGDPAVERCKVWANGEC